MKKSELLLIIKKIQNRCALEFPTKVTYYWDKERDNQVVFKIFFDSLYLPENLRIGEDNVLNAFSRSTFYEFEDEFQILEINKDKGFIKILPDDQDFKIVNSYKDSEEKKEDKKEEKVTLASNRLRESFVKQKDFIPLDEDEDKETAALINSLEGAQVNAIEAPKKSKEVEIKESSVTVNVIDVALPICTEGFDYMKKAFGKIGVKVSDDDASDGEGVKNVEDQEEGEKTTETDSSSETKEEPAQESVNNTDNKLQEAIDVSKLKNIIFVGSSDSAIKSCGLEPEFYKGFYASNAISGIAQTCQVFNGEDFMKETSVLLLDVKSNEANNAMKQVDEKTSKVVDVTEGSEKLRMESKVGKVGSLPVDGEVRLSEKDPSLPTLKEITTLLKKRITEYRNFVKKYGGVRQQVDYIEKKTVSTASQAEDSATDSTEFQDGEGIGDKVRTVVNKAKKAKANVKSAIPFTHLKGTGPSDWKKRSEAVAKLLDTDPRVFAAVDLAKTIYSKDADAADKEAANKYKKNLDDARKNSGDTKDSKKVGSSIKGFGKKILDFALAWKPQDYGKGGGSGMADDAAGMRAKDAGVVTGDSKDSKDSEGGVGLVSNWGIDFPVWIVTDSNGSMNADFKTAIGKLSKDACQLLKGASDDAKKAIKNQKQEEPQPEKQDTQDQSKDQQNTDQKEQPAETGTNEAQNTEGAEATPTDTQGEQNAD